MPPKKGHGLLMVYTDVPDDVEEEFNRWYDEEHIPERLAIPGVLSAAPVRGPAGRSFRSVSLLPGKKIFTYRC